MKIIDKFKLLTIGLFTGILLFLALPEFRIGDFQFPSVGFSRVGVPRDYPSFSKGKDLYPSTETYVRINLDEVPESERINKLNDYIGFVEKRRDSAGLFDIEIRGVITENAYELEIEVPANYEDARAYANWLTAESELQIQDLLGSNSSNLQLFDLQNLTTVSNVPIYQPSQHQDAVSGEVEINYVRFATLNSPAMVAQISDDIASQIFTVPTLSQTLSGGGQNQNNVFLAVDSVQAFSVAIDDRNQNLVWLLPTGSIPTQSFEALNDYLAIVQSYFEESIPLEFTTTIQDDKTTSIPPLFNADGSSIIALTFIIAIGLQAIYIFRQRGFKIMIIFETINVLVLLTTINLLKLFQANLSISFIFGFMILMILNNIIIEQLLTTTNKLKSFRIFTLIILFSLVGLSFYDGLQIELAEIIEILITYLISLFALSYLGINWIHEIFIKKEYKLTDIFRNV